MKNKSISGTSIRRQRWQWLLARKYPYIWLPRFIDVALNYQGDLSLEAYLQSPHFLAAAQESLLYDAEYQEQQGICLESLTPEDILYDGKIPWMFCFVKMMACRVKDFYSSHPWLKVIKEEGDLHSLCLDNIYRMIKKFDSDRGCGFEAYLHKFVPGYVGNGLRKEWRRSSRYRSLDAPSEDNSGITLLETIEGKDARFCIKEVSEEPLKTEWVLTKLKNLLQDPHDWDLFYQTTYGIKTCAQIASERGIHKSSMSRKKNSFREELMQSCNSVKEQPSRRCKKSQLQTFNKHFSSGISREDFLESIPRPPEK